MNTMGQRVKFARINAESGKMSQRALGEKVGTSQQNIAKLESGQSQETAYLVKIALATGYRAEWLESGEEPMKSNENFTDEEKELVKDYRALEPAKRSIARMAVRAMASPPLGKMQLQTQGPAGQA